MSHAHLTHQLSGFKAALARDDVSDAAKEHAREEIARIEKQLHPGQHQNGSSKTHESADDSEHDHRVAGGYRATISNPNTSEEAKDKARAELKKLGLDQESPTSKTQHSTTGDEHEHRVAGGIKAALHNDHVSDEKKAELRSRLDDMGVEAS